MEDDELDIEQAFRRSVPEDWPKWVVECFIFIDQNDAPLMGNHFTEAPESICRLFLEKSQKTLFPRTSSGIQRNNAGPALIGAYVGDIERSCNSPLFLIENGKFIHEIIRSLPTDFQEMLLKDIAHKKQAAEQVTIIAAKQRHEEKKEFFDEYNKALGKDPLPDPKHFATHEKMSALMTMCWPETENMKNRSQLQEWMADLTGQPDVYNTHNISKFCQRHHVGPENPQGRPKTIKKNK